MRTQASLNVVRFSVSADLNYVLLTHDVQPVNTATLRYVTLHVTLRYVVTSVKRHAVSSK